MNEEIRKRDVIWCKALIEILDTDTMVKVLEEFNRIRMDAIRCPDCGSPYPSGEYEAHFIGCPRSKTSVG